MKKRVVGIAVLGAAVLVVGFWILRHHGAREVGSGESTLSNEGLKALPLDMSLRFIQGGNGQSSLLKIRLFSRRLLQQDVENRVLHKGGEEAIEPLVVSCPQGFWTGRISVVLLEEGMKEEDRRMPGPEIRLVRAPEETEWTFVPGRVVEALYEIAPSTALPAGARLWIEADFGGEKLRSNDIVIPPRPADKKEELLQNAKVLLYLEKEEELLGLAEELVASFPEDPSGYLIRGWGLEKKGDPVSALAAYEEALKLYPRPGREGFVEPPMALVKKIRTLRASVSHRE